MAMAIPPGLRSSVSAKSLIVPLVACALVLSSCSSVETVDLSISLPTDIDDSLLVDSGTIPYATAEILADLASLAGEVPAADDLLRSEAVAGAAMRAEIDVAPVPGEEPIPQAAPSETVVVSALSTRAVLNPAESFLASNLTAGTLLPFLFGDEKSQNLEVGRSLEVGVTDTSGSATGSSTTTITRATENSLALEFRHEGSAPDGTTVSSAIGIDGTVCPGLDGNFDFTIKLTRNAATSSGNGGDVSEQLTVRVTGRLGEDGFPENMTIDGLQGTRHVPSTGEPIYVETRQRLEGANAFSVQSLAEMPAQLVRASSAATNADIRRLASNAAGRMAYLAWGAVLGVQSSMWNNGCVRVEAAAPTTVEPRSGIEFPVAVLSRLSGEEFPSMVEATLTGPDSVDPSSFTSTESIVFVAGEVGTSASIRLEAASRRGTASKTLTISTAARAYRGDGTNGDITVTGTICDLAKPFELAGSGTLMRFTPQNTATGTFAYRDDGTYGEGLIDLAASGSYDVTLAADGASGSITTSGTGTTGYDTPIGRQEFEFPANFTFTLNALDDVPDQCSG